MRWEFFLVFFIISIFICTVFSLFVIPFSKLKITLYSIIPKNCNLAWWPSLKSILSSLKPSCWLVFVKCTWSMIRRFNLIPDVGSLKKVSMCSFAKNDRSSVVSGVTKKTVANLRNSGIKYFWQWFFLKSRKIVIVFSLEISLESNAAKDWPCCTYTFSNFKLFSFMSTARLINSS